MQFEDVEHFFILISGLATAFGLFLAVRGWRRARDEAIAARVRQEDAIKEIAAEFKPRNGRTLAQTVVDTERSVNEHHRKADKWFEDNNTAHADIHRRIDGLYEVLGTSTAPRKTAARHLNREECP
jgi:ABC-type nickel/cobalt efflux system permease component RcnA